MIPSRLTRISLSAAFLVIAAAGLLVPAWLFPGYIECRGYTEPANWVALYAPGGGPVAEGRLSERMRVDEGSVLLVLDRSWPEHNLHRINTELAHLESEYSYLNSRLELFAAHRDVEAGELYRLLEADRLLEKSSSVSMNQLLHTEYLYESYLAGALRDEKELIHALEENRNRKRELELEEDLWEKRWSDCTLAAPANGVFYPSEAVFAPHGAVFMPPVGPGRRLEEGDLLGFIVPDEHLEIYLRIPENQAGECRVGQRVLLSADSRPAGNPPPVEGILQSISPLASGGSVEAVVGVESFEGGVEFFCGGLSARIDSRKRSAEGRFAALWEKWVFLVNPA